MKKQYIAAVACLLAGTMGFIGVYTTQQSRTPAKQESTSESQDQRNDQEQTVQTSKEVKPKESAQEKAQKEQEEKAKLEKEKAEKEKAEKEKAEKEKAEKEKAEKEKAQKEEEAKKNELHFSKNAVRTPLKGEILMPYSMDKTIHFATLDEYKYHPAVLIKAQKDDEVVFLAKGNITNIVENEETGVTVTQDLGDGYTAVYGQLGEITVKVGDSVECGQTLGRVASPTKYYSVEGCNLYFMMMKDGMPIDPTEYLR